MHRQESLQSGIHVLQQRKAPKAAGADKATLFDSQKGLTEIMCAEWIKEESTLPALPLLILRLYLK